MKSKLAFNLDVTVHQDTGALIAAYLRVRAGAVAETKEIEDGHANADYGDDGLLLGIEFLAPCSVQVLDRITTDEPERVRDFVRSKAPRELVTN